MGKKERKVISPQRGDAVVTFAHIAVNGGDAVVTFVQVAVNGGTPS